jgi:PAS domain S-box-containing protein
MYKEEEDRRIARILLGIIYVYIFFSLWLALMGVIWGDGNLIFSLIVGCGIQIIPLFFLLRGNLSASSFITVGLYIVFITIFATLGLGIRDYVVMAYPMVIVFAGMAEKQRGLVVSTLLTSMAFAWLVLGEKYRWFLANPIFIPTWFDLIITIMMSIFVALEINLMVTNLKDRLVQLRHELAERKKIEAELKESEERYRAVVSNVPVVIFVIDEKGIFTLSEGKGLAKLGLKSGQAVGLSAFDMYRDYPTVVNSLENALLGHDQRAEVEVQGTVFDANFSPVFDQYGRVEKVVGVSIDITERKQAEQKLIMLEGVQRVLVNATKSTSILLLDCQGTILTINEYGAHLIGRCPDELLGLLVFDVLPKESIDDRLIVEQMNQRFDEVRRTSAQVDFEDFRWGNWFENSMYPILDVTGNVVQVAVYARNITQRKQNEQLLRESEQRYRVLAEASHDIIFVIGQDDSIVYVNSYAALQLGTQVDALIGQPRSRWFENLNSDRMRKGLETVFETGEPTYAEADIIFPSGPIYLSTWLVPLIDQNGRVDNVLGVSRDISAQKKLQDSLKEANLRLNSLVDERTAELRDSRDQLRTLSQKVIFAQEEERLRLSRDLHDDAGQALIGLRLNLELIFNDLPVNSKKLRDRMKNTLALIDQTVNRIRTLSHNLRPPVLDILGINMGIKDLCSEFSNQTGIEVEYVGLELKNLRDEISISLYRFVQEALTNAAKHARARKVKVVMEYHDEMIKLSAEDDGQGISINTEGSGMGMVGIQERFNNLGGQLKIGPGVRGGLLVQVILPWQNTAI